MFRDFWKEIWWKKRRFCGEGNDFFGSGNTAVYINSKFIVLCAIMGEMNDDFSNKVV